MADMKAAAVLTIKRAWDMTPKGRREVADWLRQQAEWLELSGDSYSDRFRAFYRYAEKD